MSWPLVKLGAVCKLVNGDRGTNYPSKDSVLSHGIPFINAGNLTEEHSIVCSGANYISEERYDLLSNGKVQYGDILFCLRGSLGKFAVVDSSVPKGAIASSLVIIRPDKSICENYLKNYLRSTLCAREISRFENGAAQPNLSAKDLREFEIPLPPLPEQKRIATILDKADAIRRKRQQAIQLADDFLRAVFLDMLGDPVTNPKGWPKKSLKLLGKSATGRTPPSEKADMWGEGLPFVTPGDLSGRVDSSVREVTQEGAEHSKVCRTGSLLVCCIGATIGKVGIAGCPVAFNQQINAQEWGAEILDVYGYFVFKLFPDLVRERAIQTTLPILKKSLFDEIEIPVPAKGIQEKFAVLAQKISSFSARHESGVEMPIFESLSQLAFSGQL
ncbi:restriction endonuclease subunit S [Stutzerimonas chloritidismutans]|uniref:restriction endonuclease subunit S n=1 Tax=Stutzerimonas chloritidismutans TaxID=203192 RepID=UPI00384EC5E2